MPLALIALLRYHGAPTLLERIRHAMPRHAAYATAPREDACYDDAAMMTARYGHEAACRVYSECVASACNSVARYQY